VTVDDHGIVKDGQYRGMPALRLNSLTWRMQGTPCLSCGQHDLAKKAACSLPKVF